jgi:haloacetate dehalogenase
VTHDGPVFEDFVEERRRAEDLDLFVRHGGSGPAVVLLHGHPRTSSTWFRVAPALLRAGYSVVCPDLLGYGRSAKPEPTPDHASHSKRSSAREIAGLMTALGHDTFSVVGHDRGSYVGLRLCLDHRERVETATLIDCLPISEHLDRVGVEFATAWWHWFFFAQPGVPERVINADPDACTQERPNSSAWRTTTSFAPPPATPRSCEGCSRTTGPD